MPRPGSQSTAPARQEVLAYLSHLLGSPSFRRSSNSTRLLRFLVVAALDRPDEDISQYVIAQEVLGLGVDFDADRNPLVRMQVARLRRALARHYGGPGLLDPIRFGIPPGGYLVTMSRPGRPSRDAPRRLPRTVSPLLALVEFRGLGMSGVWEHLPAVLAEELSVCLGQLPGLRILGPLSRRRLDAENIEPGDLGRRHAADFVLDGSIEALPRRHLIRVRLLEAGSGAQVWSACHHVDSGQDGFSGLELEVIRKVAEQIGSDYGVIPLRLSALARVRPAASLDVHEAVVTARAYFQDLEPASLLRALAVLRHAVRRHPAEALPRATLSLVLASTVGHPGWTQPIPLGEITAHARSAYELDPSDHWSILALASAAMLRGRDDELDALASRMEAEARIPTHALGSLGLWMVLRRVRVAQGRRWVRAALVANPHHLPILHEAFALAALEKGDAKALRKAIAAYGWPKGWLSPLLGAVADALEGDASGASRKLDLVRRADPLFASHGLGRFQSFAHPVYARLVADRLAKVALRPPRTRALAGLR